MAPEQQPDLAQVVLLLVGLVVVAQVGRRGGLAGRGLVLLDQLPDLCLAEQRGRASAAGTVATARSLGSRRGADVPAPG